ncbi:MAG: cytidylate kinase family protein [Candidatus Aenigmarchaeota archaeon]|nr:cytidylate kinase family protein [Candidatus Aenigmarchaeota archaeon]
MIITISGTPGSGKDTVAKIISKKFGMKLYQMGNLCRELAAKHKLTLQELNELGEKEIWIDTEIDNKTTELGKKEDNFIAVGRTAYHFIPHSIKIYLDVELDKAAGRIMHDRENRKNENIQRNIRKEIELIKERIESDRSRYKKHYSIDITDQNNYDLWIDTTKINAKQVADQIIKFIKIRITERVSQTLRNNKHEPKEYRGL